ncbi:MAG: TetR/AcrR family transcriptional regulator [Myxococcota bacterium]
MARQIPSDRFEALHAAATEILIAEGYGRTQMDDIAKALGVAKGTLYQYVESKQALFDFVLRHVHPDASIPVPDSLPLPTPRPGATLRFVREQIEREGQLPLLAAALADPATPADPAAELDEIVRELFELLTRNRVGIKLLERCSRDYPELHAIWHGGGRYAVVDLLCEFITARIRMGCYAPAPDPRVSARFVQELVTTWAVHVRWDPAPQDIPDEAALETAMRFVRGGLLLHP